MESEQFGCAPVNKKEKLKISLQENHVIVPSYQHYGSVSGYQDYGINGIKIKNNIIKIWKEHFLSVNEIEEIETPIIMPHDILKASGHVDRFTDFVVFNPVTKIFIRADHLVKDYYKKNNMDTGQVDSFDQQKLECEINKYDMLDLKCDIKVGKKNLMFNMQDNDQVEYLRPELAQGIFVNYDICHNFLQKEPPFGIAQVGKSFRKEISPKQFTRMREFTQAEIEYFVDPKNKSVKDFKKISDIQIPVLSAKMQEDGSEPVCMTVGDAVKNSVISSETMAYFLAKIFVFIKDIGIDISKIRFRQHMPNEMAHYASECWDLETFVNNDWLECVGCADRGDYDLKAHSAVGKISAKRIFDKPVEYIKRSININKKELCGRYKENSNKLLKYLLECNCDDKSVRELESVFVNNISIDGIDFELTSTMVSFYDETIVQKWEEYVPCVIEPSFGIDRLMYTVLEHNFYARTVDKARLVLSLPVSISPYHVAVFQLYKTDIMMKYVGDILAMLSGFRCYSDFSSTNIGKRYVRADEMGIKYVITVDVETDKDKMVTVRERDSMKQERVLIVDIIKKLSGLQIIGLF